MKFPLISFFIFSLGFCSDATNAWLKVNEDITLNFPVNAQISFSSDGSKVAILRNSSITQGVIEVYSDDVDDDGLSNLNEDLIGTNPRLSDSDGDGILDGIEASMTNNMKFIFDPTINSSNEINSVKQVFNDMPYLTEGKVKSYQVGEVDINVSNGVATIRIFMDESMDGGDSWSATTNFIEVVRPAIENTKFFGVEYE